MPGAVVTENGTILGPPRKVFGIGMREVLREGLYDTEAWATEESGE